MMHLINRERWTNFGLHMCRDGIANVFEALSCLWELKTQGLNSLCRVQFHIVYN